METFGLPGALVQAHHDLSDELVVRLLDGDVVHERQGLHAHHIKIVHVHGDAVDAHGVPLSHCIGDEELGAHAVRGHGQSELPEVDEPGVCPYIAHGGAKALTLESQSLFNDARLDGLEFIDVHACAGVCHVLLLHSRPMAVSLNKICYRPI